VQIEGKVFVVTGASSGIGLSTAKALSSRRAKVALLARSTESLDKLSRELPNSLAVSVDVTDFPSLRKSIADTHAHFGQIDGLINNAGRSYAASIEEIDPVIFDEIFHLNVLAPIIAMQAVIPIMRSQGEFALFLQDGRPVFLRAIVEGVEEQNVPDALFQAAQEFLLNVHNLLLLTYDRNLRFSKLLM